MTKFECIHFDLIKAHPGELPQQERLSECHSGVFYFEKIHKIEIELLMHKISDFGSDGLHSVEFF